MPTFESGDITLEQVREHVWEIPREGKMRVPARVLASERLLQEISQDRTLEQLKNATHLPGITKYAICMPDGHQGYGFPVGGVGATDVETGCISPGAVGYDINCLSGDTEVLLEFGRHRRIDDFEDDFETQQALVAAETLRPSPILLYSTTDTRPVYEVITREGDTIRATSDHPFLTPHGMQELGDLNTGDTVLMQPFVGFEDEQPEDDVILTDADFAETDPHICSTLQELGLIPLHTSDDAFQRLLKLVGFFAGSGSFGNGDQTVFYGDLNDLTDIRHDIQTIGFEPLTTDTTTRPHEINETEVHRTNHCVRVTDNAFKTLLIKLGVSSEETDAADCSVPDYVEHLTDWQQALYLSTYFGADMVIPFVESERIHAGPEITRTRIIEHSDPGEKFLREIASILDDLGIETNAIERSKTTSIDGHEKVRFRLAVNHDPNNLIRFFSTVGFRYNREKRTMALRALQYLKYIGFTTDSSDTIPTDSIAITDGGSSSHGTSPPRDPFGEPIEQRIGNERPPSSRPTIEVNGFNSFCKRATVHENLTIETIIHSITPAGTSPVYDIGIKNEAHNFVADGFVVSNCGVRMMNTNLEYDDLRGREVELVESLFSNVPSGLGGGGIVETDVQTVDEILSRGVEWAVETGWAVEADLDHCEDEGLRSDADPSKISKRAKERGKNQIGSLGSGNHFLEVQRVTDIFLDEAADAYGLKADQIVVLIHCGSRGLGHQVCSDYLRKIEQTHPDVLAELPDKELAAAPAGSQLAEDYYGAMCAAINFAWTNRQLVMHRTRQVFERVFDRTWEELDMHLLYDVAHNIAKKEIHDVNGEDRELYVHRKGATRAFPAGRHEVPSAYRSVGQPIIIPGSMGAGSYVLRGGERSMYLTFGSTAHGAGRLMSRTQAKKTFWGGDVQQDLEEQQHIYVKAQSGATVAEEAPGVYKDVDEVVRVSDALGIGDRVARTFPICNIKG